MNKNFPDVSGLVTKAALGTKVDEIENEIPNHDKHITTQKFNKLKSEDFLTRFKEADLANKKDISAFVKKGRF